MPKGIPKRKAKREQDSRRRFDRAFKAGVLAALDANAGNVKRTATQFGIPEPTLRSWAAGTRGDPVPPAMVEAARQELRVVYEDTCRNMAVRLRTAPLDENLYSSALALGILTDKLLLLDGRPTVIEETAARHTIDWSRLSSNEILAMSALQAKLRGEDRAVGMPALPEPVTAGDAGAGRADRP